MTEREDNELRSRDWHIPSFHTLQGPHVVGHRGDANSEGTAQFGVTWPLLRSSLYFLDAKVKETHLSPSPKAQATLNPLLPPFSQPGDVKQGVGFTLWKLWGLARDHRNPRAVSSTAQVLELNHYHACVCVCTFVFTSVHKGPQKRRQDRTGQECGTQRTCVHRVQAREETRGIESLYKALKPSSYEKS